MRPEAAILQSQDAEELQLQMEHARAAALAAGPMLAHPEDGVVRVKTSELRDWRHRLPQLTSRDEPILVAVPTKGALDLLLANGPAVGLPFIMISGVQQSQMQRFAGYFAAIWDQYAAGPKPLQLPAEIRPAVHAGNSERDQLGIAVRRHPEGTAPVAGRPELRAIAEIWPEAELALMSLTIPTPSVRQSGGLRH